MNKRLQNWLDHFEWDQIIDRMIILAYGRGYKYELVAKKDEDDQREHDLFANEYKEAAVIYSDSLGIGIDADDDIIIMLGFPCECHKHLSMVCAMNPDNIEDFTNNLLLAAKLKKAGRIDELGNLGVHNVSDTRH